MTSAPRDTWTTRWERYWFADVPPHVYALLRIAFGGAALAGLIGLTPVAMFWPLDGVSPVPGEGLGIRAAVAARGLGDAVGWALFGALACAFTATTLGWRSRVVVPLCVLLAIVQAHWNNLPLSGAHQVLIAFLFCLAWADTGAVWSIDAWRAAATAEADPIAAAHPIWPLRLLRVQVALIYLGSGVWKFLEPMWRDGTAVHYVARNNVFHRFPVEIPGSAEGILTLATWVTLVWELAFPLLILHRWTRRMALALGVLLHGGMWLLLELGPFSWLMISSYLAFLDPTAVARVAQRVQPTVSPLKRVAPAAPQ